MKNYHSILKPILIKPIPFRFKFILSFFCLFTIIPEAEAIDPIAICQDYFVQLDYSGTKFISPQNVNGGSFDPDGTIVNFSLDQDLFTCADIGINVVTLTVEDNDGNTATCTANVTVSFPSQTLACISQVNLSLDIDGNGILEPDDVLAGPFFDPCGLFTVTPSMFTCDDIGQHTVTVEDGAGNFCWLTVIVEDKIPPTFIYPEDITLECGEDTDPSITGEPIIIDNCGTYGTSYFDQTLILPGPDVIINREWTIIEWVTGDTDTYIQVLDPEDDQSPTAICVANLNIALDQFGTATLAPEAVDAGSYDDCGDVTLSVSPSTFDCSNIGDSIVVILTVTDESGNTNQCWSQVTVEDKKAPTPICFSSVNVILGTDGTATISPADIDAGSFDNCGPVTLSLSQTTFDCSDIGNSLFVTLTATDQSGNSDFCVAEIIVEDNTPLDILFPDDIDLSCNADTDPSVAGEPFIIDNCSFYGVTFDDQIFALAGNTVKILRTWTVIDWLTGDIFTHIQIIKTIDTTSPTAICVANINISLDATGNAILQPEAIDAGSYDDCGDVTLSVSPSTFDCSNIGDSIVVILTVTDESGNTNQCWSQVTVEDKKAPTPICFSLVNVILGADGTATITPDDIDAGSFDNCGPVTLSLSQTTFDCSDIGNSLFVTLTATDQSGNSDFCIAEIIVEDNTPLDILFPDDIDLSCNADTDPSVAGEPFIIDNCSFYAVTFDDQIFALAGNTVKILRTWTVIDWLTGDIFTHIQIIKTIDTTSPTAVCFADINLSLDASGNATLLPEAVDAGSYDDCGGVTLSVSPSSFDCSYVGDTVVVILTVTDESGNTNQCWANVYIEDKIGPTAVCNSTVNVSLGADGTATITPDVIDAGSFDNCGPVTLSLDQSTFDCSDILNDSLIVIMTVTDASGNTNQCWTQIVVEDKLPPVVTCPPDLTLDCSQGDNLDPTITGTPEIDDNCDLIAYAYEDLILPICGGSFKVLRTWTVVDWYSGSVQECIQVISVLDITPPNIVCLNQLNASLGFNGSLTLYSQDLILSATDNCDSVSYTITEYQFDCSDIGDTTLIVEAIDGCGNLSQCLINVTIEDNTSPTAVCNAQVNVSLDANGMATITPAVIDAGSYDECGPVTLSIDQSTFDCSDILNDSLIVILTVTDASGNTNQCWTQIIVEDKLPPVVTCPLDLTIECSQAGNLDPILTGSPFVVDNCDLIGYSYEDNIFELDGSNYKVIREWTVVDWYSNTFVYCTQVINVIDLNPPNMVCLNQLSASLDANGSLTLFPEDLDAGTNDDCGTFDLTISQSQFDCTDVGSNNVTLTATDENGNSSQCIVEVIIFGLDADEDGFSICEGDCDDNNGSISPGEQEVCGDNIDNNCDGNVDENCICASYAESTEYEWIETVDANGTSNNSGDDGGYGDYTSTTLPMTIGNNSIELTPGFAGSSYNEFWSVWIDLNQNGLYEASEELLAQNSTSTITSTISIPSSALLGTTTMRISMKYGQTSDPCEIFAEGEVEDYTVDISPPLYCISEGASTQYEWIKRVRLKSINNLSGNDNGYGDYTNLSTNLNPGQSKNIKLKPGFSGSSYVEYWRVWVDWNDDGDFDDAGELEVQVSSSGNITDQITVPGSATSGDKRMRVSMKYGGYPQPCETFTYGEVEDYTIFVTGSNPLVSNNTSLDLTSSETQTQNISEEIIEVRTVDTEFKVHLYPNPTSNFINIEFKASSEAERKLTMYNEMGQLVYQSTVDQNNITIDITQSQFTNGLYVLMMQQGEQVISKRIIISK